MDRFQVIQPSVLLAPYVKQYWFVTMENVVQSSQRLVPFGCTVLSFHRGNRTYSSLKGDYLPLSHLYGIATEYTDLVFSGYIDFICIIFQPTEAGSFFRMPLGELNNSYVPVDVLSDPELRELEQRLNDMPDDTMCVGLIEPFLLRRIYQLDAYNNKRIAAVMDSIRNGETDVDRLAETACLSYKQFKRIFMERIGTNPKNLLQIVRFQKLHRLLQQHVDMTVVQLAYECGYYDKSHLIKEVKDFSGFTPAELLEACDPIYSDYHALFRSAFIDLPSDFLST